MEAAGATLERMVGRQALEIEFLIIRPPGFTGSRNHNRFQRSNFFPDWSSEAIVSRSCLKSDKPERLDTNTPADLNGRSECGLNQIGSMTSN